MSAPTPVERAAEALETAMKGVLLLTDDEVAPTYARAVFESIDVEALALAIRDANDDGMKRWLRTRDFNVSRFDWLAEAVKAHLTGAGA